MFNVKHNECVGFESKWKVKKVSANSASQTTEFSVSEKGSDTVERKSQEAQTETTQKPSEEVEMSKLANWLNKIYPNVKEQIDKSNSSRAFQNYRTSNTSVDSLCKLVQSFSIAGKNADDGDKAIPIINCLDWNNSGKLLAVSHSFKHRTWCHHTGTVSIYSFARDKTLSESFMKRLSTESCVTTLKFHSNYSNILAAGTFTGHIYIWNIGNDVDALICNTVAHDEYITQISWVHDMDSACLASSSTDSLLKMWTFNVADNLVKLKTIFKIKTPIFGKIDDTMEVPKSLIDKGDLGIVCFDFSLHVPDMFVVALEGGLIARCSLLGLTKIKANSGDVSHYYDPVFKYYELHRGEIVSIKFPLQTKDMFLTSATDGEIRIYLVHQTEPAQVIFLKSPLNEISYVLHEKKLLAACGQGGFLEVFQLQTGKPIELTFNVKITKRNLTSMAVNGSETNYVVVGNNNGEIQLWDVPWQNIE
ncbi:unnamed protein product [Ceutorhynchus assimilis]|uniref:Dynein axonemal intermediate chain 4 n=1 Tax=Ceutorhynchus assimilis TaxID=467358 RepID=A0A9N9Q9T9_9CUCU|nr:unnamed protein product [Ceutorhynchus assimilis]